MEQHTRLLVYRDLVPVNEDEVAISHYLLRGGSAHRFDLKHLES